MSDIREDLLSPGINKKRVIAIVLTVVILISFFAFSTYFLNLFFGSARISPNDNLDDAPEETPQKNIPPIPWTIDDLMNLFNDLNLSDDQLDEFMDMNDWDVDDLDLSDFASLAGALLFSEVEVFRVSEYDDFNEMQDKLWRYECFDQFNGSDWTSSTSMDNYEFYTSDDYNNFHSDKDLIDISIPISPDVGSYSFVIPNLFPIPFIMQDSVTAPNLNPDSTVLLKDDFNCTTLDLDFASESNVNVSYTLFGDDLPSDSEINSSAITHVTNPTAEYTNLLNQFTSLSPNNETYVNGNPFFQTHFQNLFSLIDPSDNNFVIADKIRDYIAYNFEVSVDAHQTDPPEDEEDIVYWFCEKEEGIWSDFASAFAIFSRTFNVPSRFVTGYNSWGIEEISGENEFAIKYKNIYNWIEIYVPTDIYGNGMWVQMDVFSGNIPDFNVSSDYSIEVTTDDYIVNRGESVNITATLKSNTLSVVNRTITFEDVIENITIGVAQTDAFGNATITLDINNSYTVGPQIVAAYHLTAYNATSFILNGDVSIDLNNVTPQIINISDSLPDETLVEGRLYDPINNDNISNAEVSFLLFQKGSNLPIPFALNPITTTTNDLGQFSQVLSLDPSVPTGDYEIKADFNGTWWLYGYPVPFPFINDSSNRMDLTIVEELQNILHFYVDNYEANNYYQPSVIRGETIKLKAVLFDETFSPINNATVEFYDYTNSQLIGENLTNINGIATWDYNIGSSISAGPNILYIRYDNLYNYSYYILNAPINITLNSCPDPPEVNISGSFGREFTISGKLQDAFNGNPIGNGQISVHMFSGGIDYAGSSLIFVSGNYLTDSNGDFSLTYKVDSSTTAQNYTIEIWFNGTFQYFAPLPNTFSLSIYSNFSYSASCNKELKVLNPEDITIILKVEGQYTSPSYDILNPPPTYNFGEITNIEVWINQSGNPAPLNSIVHLWDIFTNTELDNYTFDGSEGGYHNFQISTSTLHAGLHRLNITFETSQVWSTYNNTYLVINESVNLFTDQTNLQVTRDIDNFIISGRIKEKSDNLRGLIVNLIMLDNSSSDVTSYLNFIGSSSILISDDGTFQFSISSIDLSCPQGEYYIRIDFNGTISYSTLYLPNYMISNSSRLINLTVYAGSDIIPDTYYTEFGIFPEEWITGDTLHVIGNLTFDNGNPIIGVNLNLTVKFLNGTIISFNDTVVTDSYGGFDAILKIDENWPTQRSQTEIWVYFNGFNLINGTNEQYL